MAELWVRDYRFQFSRQVKLDKIIENRDEFWFDLGWISRCDNRLVGWYVLGYVLFINSIQSWNLFLGMQLYYPHIDIYKLNRFYRQVD